MSFVVTYDVEDLFLVRRRSSSMGSKCLSLAPGFPVYLQMTTQGGSETSCENASSK